VCFFDTRDPSRCRLLIPGFLHISESVSWLIYTLLESIRRGVCLHIFARIYKKAFRGLSVPTNEGDDPIYIKEET
jgi:hypothetical protein